MKNEFKVIVAHPGRQHSYQLAAAVKAHGCLLKYVTTYYNRKNSLIARLPFLGEIRSRAAGRLCESLDDSDVVTFCRLGFLLVALLLRIDKSGRLYRMANDRLSVRFGRNVARFAIKHRADAVVMYDANAYTCFAMLKEKAPHILRIQDVSAINRLYMREVYAADMIRSPQFASQLMSERGFLFDDKYQRIRQSEIELSDRFLVPSKIVEKSLAYSGVDESRMFLCPYGCDFAPDRAQHEVKTPLEVLYVGSVTQMKGIFYLLEAFGRLPEDEFHLTVVGRFDSSSELFEHYKARVDFVGYVMHDAVKSHLENADVFVFPSLGDSFGLAVLEAMSYGLPVICSDHAGASDAVVDGENGFVVPVGDVDAIVEKLRYCREHPEFMASARERAYATAESYTWSSYRERVAEILESVQKARCEK